MLFHITITDVKGLHKIMDVIATNLLDAGILAEKQYEESLEKESKKEKEGD